MGQNGDFAFLPIPSHIKISSKMAKFQWILGKFFEKKILKNRRKLTPQKYIHPSDTSRGRFVYSFDKPKALGLPRIIFFPKHGIFATC